MNSRFIQKARTTSKLHVVLQHKKNVLGEVVYKGIWIIYYFPYNKTDNPSWELMLNIQMGIRNVVGKSAEVIKETDSNKVDEISKTKGFFTSTRVLFFPP
jgi:hypothetical protein